MKDVTKALQAHFSAAKIPLSLPPELRRVLQSFVDEQDGKILEGEAINVELKTIWEKHVLGSPQKLGAFTGVLRELRSAINGEEDVLDWWRMVVKPVVSSTRYGKPAQEDAKEFLVCFMVYDDEEDEAEDVSLRVKTANQLYSELFAVYIGRSRGLTEDDKFIAQENLLVVHQVEDFLTAFGRKRPRDLFHSLNDLVIVASTRLQSLTLLSSFLRHQVPHLYLVVHTPLFEHLLKCLMNDTSTTVLSVALTCLIMLLPHIPGSLGPYLPRLFLVYSRLLCWEKFSALSSEAERSLVTDDRVSTDTDYGREPGDVGIDANWEKARPQNGIIEVDTPQLLTYFTYLYGLYPLNFMSYIRKPRRYLKNIDFSGADAFDLDQAVIRSRTEQFRQMHLLHPNFCNMTVEEELIDPKWPKIEPSDVVGECHALFMDSRTALLSPGPPPSAKLPDIPPVPPLSTANMRMNSQLSPSASHASFRTGSSWRDTQSTAASVPPAEGGSPRPPDVESDDDVLPPQLRTPSKASPKTLHTSPSFDDSRKSGSAIKLRRSEEKLDAPPITNLAYLQRELTLLRNDLNFERWHKAQYGQHIGQIMRRNVKEATVEAETLNLINANRALKKQLDQVRKAREATIKDSALTRKQANILEANMTERFNKMKSQQETWQADADELRRLRGETKQYRDLLVATEQRELNKAHQLELAQRDLEQLQKLQAQLKHAQRRLQDYEDYEFEFENANRLRDITQRENEALQMTLQQQEEDRERLRRAYATKVTELEAQLTRPTSGQSSTDTQVMVQQAVSDSQARLTQLKKAHSRLLEKYTDLELEYQSAMSQLETYQGGYAANRSTLSFDSRQNYSDPGYDIISDYHVQSEGGSTSDPSNRRFVPRPLILPTPSESQATMQSAAASRMNSFASQSSGSPAAFNQSAPLAQDEGKSVFSDSSGGVANTKKEKIKPDSTMRVYGRGGAQNIKLKQKDGQKSDIASGKKPSGLRGLRNLV